VSPLDDWLPQSKVLKQLSVSRWTILRWERQGIFPRRSRKGGRVGWFRSEVESFMASLTKGVVG
jgi:predicted DNA-binding transcriptional regulator AlpA